MPQADKNIIVVGLGNPTLSDDTAGLLMLDDLERNYSVRFPNTKFVKNYSGGFDLLYEFIDFKKAIIIDSICTNRVEPGTCIEYLYEDLKKMSQPRLVDSHGLNLPIIMTTGERCGYVMPEEIYIFGIEGREFTLFSESPTKEVKAGFASAIEIIVGKLTSISTQT